MVNVVLIELQIAGEQIDELLRHPFIDLQTYRIAESAAPHGFLHAFKQVVSLELLNRKLRVACDMEQVGFKDVHLRKKQPQVGNNDLLQPDKRKFGPGRWDLDNCGSESGTLMRAKRS